MNSVPNSPIIARLGFSLIELITVVSITAIISVTAVSVLINTQIRGNKANSINQVREAGEELITILTFELRNAKYLEVNRNGTTCTAGMPAIRFRTYDDKLLEYYLDSTTQMVASSSAGNVSSTPNSYLSSNRVVVSNLAFNCSQQPGEQGAAVEIVFTAETGSANALANEFYYQQDFSTRVYIRSYR